VTLLQDWMLADLERGLSIARDGHEVVPAWRVLTPDGDFLILTRFDPDKPEQRERALALVPRFMALMFKFLPSQLVEAIDSLRIIYGHAWRVRLYSGRLSDAIWLAVIVDARRGALSSERSRTPHADRIPATSELG
jgi:hypothetical protein